MMTELVETNLFPSVEAGSLQKEIRNRNLPVEVEHFGHDDNKRDKDDDG